METRHVNEPPLASQRSRDEAIQELPSPPRIRRLQNRRRRNDSEDSDSDHDTYWIDFPLATPSRSSSGPNCNVTEFRRRLEIVKERRARNTDRYESLRRLSEHATGRNDIDCPTTHGEHYHSSTMLNEQRLDSRNASPIEKSKPSAPLNDSPVSTCQTLDEITLNTTMDSTKLWPTSPRVHRLPSSRPSIGKKHVRKGGCVDKDYLNLRRLMCSSSDKNIDTSFAQITDAICKTNRTSDDFNRHSSETRYGNDNSADHGYLEGGEFPENRVSSSASSRDVPENGLLDRLFCSSALSMTPRRNKLESSTPKSMRRSSSLRFRMPTEHNNENDHRGFQDGFRSNSTSSPGHSRRSHQKSLWSEIPPTSHNLHISSRNRGTNYHTMDSDVPIGQQQSQVNEIDKIGSLYNRNSASFSFFRKDPWYLRSSSCREGGDEMVIDGDDTYNEVLDRVMHAVVFVEESEI